jgi:hypothetical protein
MPEAELSIQQLAFCKYQEIKDSYKTVYSLFFAFCMMKHAVRIIILFRYLIKA